MKRTLKNSQPSFRRKKDNQSLKAKDVLEVEIHTPTPMGGVDKKKEHHYPDQLRVIGESFYLPESDFKPLKHHGKDINVPIIELIKEA